MEHEKQPLENNLERLRNVLEEFIDLYEQDYNYSIMIYEYWNAKNILGHVTFWHESFARNISDLGNGSIPRPLKGKLSEVNRLSIESTNPFSIAELIGRLRDAQKIIELHIFNTTIDRIPYKKGSRDYSRCEHLEIVANHINKHLKDLKKKYGKTTDQIRIAASK